jgi:serine/threonine-protein kinase
MDHRYRISAADHTPSSPSSGTVTLPEDLLREQVARVELLNAVGVLLWCLNLAMDRYLSPNGDRGPYGYLIECGGAALCAAMGWYARFGGASARSKVEVCAWTIPAHGLGLALLNSWAPLPTTMRAVSPITVLILLFAMLAPARPRLMLGASLVAATMDPLGVWIAHLRGLPVPGVAETFLFFYPNYACAILAVAPARVLYRLGRKIREARDLGAYELVERLGGGGMGEVWRARHRMLARPAAIKLIRSDVADGPDRTRAAVATGRFEREARATAALTSPHTVRVFDYGLTTDGRFYYAMELLEGRDLQSLVRDFGPLPPARVRHLARQVCLSLAEAHAARLVHRDVKPANIFVGRRGLEHDFVTVLDFGLVQPLRTPEAVTMPTTGPIAMGTPGYMAPEVILGQPETDCRVDVYAVGCVLYFMLTGGKVFGDGEPLGVMMRHVQEMPEPPSRCSPHDVPGDLDRLVLACLKKDPALRPRDARDLLDRLDHCRMDDDWTSRAAHEWWAACLPSVAGVS